MGIGESIRKGHDEYRRYFAKLLKTTPKDAKLRERLFLEFQKKLYAHHEAETMTIFPKMIKIPELKELTLELMVEHADMKLHFGALLKEECDTEIWPRKLAPLYDVMHAHWLKEEEAVIPFWPEYFSESVWEDLGKRFDEAVEEYMKKH